MMKHLKRLLPVLLLGLLLAGCSGGGKQAVPTEAPTLEPTPEPTALPSDMDMVAPAPAAPESTDIPEVNSAPAQSQGGSVAVYPAYTTAPYSLLDNADLVVGMVAAAGSGFNPITGNSRDIDSLTKLVFESVVELSDELEPVGLLADSWTINQETVTFTLRQGVRFHDGTYFTANDVLNSYNAILTFGEFSPYYARVQHIREMNVLDDYTLEVVSQAGGYTVLYAMTFPIISALSMDSVLPKGTGPYWYTATDANGDIRLERNPLWWKRQSHIQAIVGRRYDTDKDVLTAFEARQVDCVATRSAAAALSRQLSDRSTMVYSTTTWECLVPNLNDSILGEEPVRRAIMYGIDRSTVANTVYLGIVQESEVPVIPGSVLYETQSAQYNYNPERALQILYEAGWEDTNGDGVLDRIKDGLWEDLSFVITTYDEPGINIRTEAINLIAQQLNRIGFKVTTSTISRTRMESNLAGKKHQLALVAFNLSEYPDLTFLFHSRGRCNFTGYTNERMDALLNDAAGAASLSALYSAMSDIQLLVVEDLPLLGLFFRTGVLMSDVSLGGLTGIRESYTLRGIQYVNID